MPNYTGTVESFSTYNPYPNAPINATQYYITIAPDGGGSAISFSGNDVGKRYTKGDKITYSGTQGPKGDMLYTIFN